MPPQGTPPWQQAARRLRGYGYGSQGSLRVSDAERAEVADLLSRHYGDGRLDKAEFEQRMDLAMHARTYADLGSLLADLPQPEAADSAATGSPGSPARYQRPGRRHHPLLALGLIVVAGVIAWQALASGWATRPWGWFGPGPWPVILLIVLIAVYVTRRRS